VSTALSIMLAIAGATAVLTAIAFANRASVVEDLDVGSFQSADDLVVLGAGLNGLTMIATIVLWLVWQFRHAKNAELLGKHDGLTAGWAIGGWFIPLAQYVLGPLQLLQSAKWSDPNAPGQGRVPGVLVAWWVLYAGQALVSISSGRFVIGGDNADSIDDLDDLQSADQMSAVSSVILLAAAICAIVMVRQLTRSQHEALAARGIPVV
jgi:hypothetical protein